MRQHILLLRDQVSLELARNEFPRATCLLCPDMACALDPLSRRGAARVDIVMLTRSDHELHPRRPPVSATTGSMSREADPDCCAGRSGG